MASRLAEGVGEAMRIAVASDHAAYTFKERLGEELRRLGHEVVDFGTDSTESCDYPDYSIPAVRAVASKDVERAILACTNGIGMSMVANKIQGIRAALVYNEKSAAMTSAHHDSNVLCLGAQEFPFEDLPLQRVDSGRLDDPSQEVLSDLLSGAAH